MKTRGALLLLLPLTLVHFTPAHASWQSDGNAMCTALQDQATPVSVSDGAGGAIVAWQDNRGPETEIYAQRIDVTGAALWTANGVALCVESGNQFQPTIVTDGAGGAIVAWTDLRPNGLDGIYVQRVDAAGVPQWAINGVPLFVSETTEFEPESVSDGAGGAFVVWARDYGGAAVVHCRRINAAGVPQWADAIPLAQVSARAKIIADGVGGAIIAWEDYRNAFPATDVYAQRVNAAGTTLWAADGVALCTATGNQHAVALTTDGAAGAIVAWVDPRNNYYNTYARRINASGTPQWASDGIPMTFYDDIERDETTIASDGAGGAIVAWKAGGAPYFDIQAQRFNGAGTILWNEEDGVLVCNAAFDQLVPKMISDTVGGAIITWQDQRNGNPTYDDIYAQRLNASGVRQWSPLNGAVVCDFSAEQWAPVIVPDGSGGAVIAWQDRRTSQTTNFDIYANRIGLNGTVPTGVGGSVPTPSLIVGSARPNPFSDATSLDIALETTSDVKIDVVDVSGRRVRRMILKDVPGGALRLDFDGRNDRGARLANGIYFCKVSVAGATVTRKFVIIR